MKSDKIAQFIYANPLSPSSEILVRCLQQSRDEFLDYLFEIEGKQNDSLRFCNFLAGQEVAQINPNKLFQDIKSNRENILAEFNKLFWK
jgi:hypothetical protein